MKTTCNCGNSNIYPLPRFRSVKGNLFKYYSFGVSQYICLHCGWKGDEIKTFVSGSPYTFFGKLSCKLFGHKEFELTSNNVTNYVVVSSCKRCGFIIKNINNYERLQKLKKLKK